MGFKRKDAKDSARKGRRFARRPTPDSVDRRGLGFGIAWLVEVVIIVSFALTLA